MLTRSHTQSTASNLEQVANLLCAQANSAFYPQRDGKWVVAMATRWRPSVADWTMACLLAAPWVQLSVSAGNGWPHNALQHHWLMPISCHFRDCNALLVTSLTHVSGAIAGVQTFTFIGLLTIINWLVVNFQNSALDGCHRRWLSQCNECRTSVLVYSHVVQLHWLPI